MTYDAACKNRIVSKELLMSDKNNHAEIIELVRKAARAGDEYVATRRRLSEALGLDPKGDLSSIVEHKHLRQNLSR
jgi:hypothetical protein